MELTEFNKGWWNCFCSFANNSYSTHSDNLTACYEVMRGAGVTKDEIDAILSSGELYGVAVDIVNDYRFQEGL